MVVVIDVEGSAGPLYRWLYAGLLIQWAVVRAFLVPKINFGASTYYDMIERDDITESLLTKDITRECIMVCLSR